MVIIWVRAQFPHLWIKNNLYTSIHNSPFNSGRFTIQPPPSLTLWASSGLTDLYLMGLAGFPTVHLRGPVCSSTTRHLSSISPQSHSCRCFRPPPAGPWKEKTSISKMPATLPGWSRYVGLRRSVIPMRLTNSAPKVTGQHSLGYPST